jgi:hypothetical protein
MVYREGVWFPYAIQELAWHLSDCTTYSRHMANSWPNLDTRLDSVARIFKIEMEMRRTVFPSSHFSTEFPVGMGNGSMLCVAGVRKRETINTTTTTNHNRSKNIILIESKDDTVCADITPNTITTLIEATLPIQKTKE